jgi:uncharacterized protein YbaR (Trm112 family)
MDDLVFSCPACRKPLVVESSTQGTGIECPLCRASIKVPTVKTARILDPRRLEQSLLLKELESKVTGKLFDLQQGLDSLERKLDAQSLNLRGWPGKFARVVPAPPPVEFSPETVPGAASRTPLWKRLTLVFGSLAFACALALAVRAH